MKKEIKVYLVGPPGSGKSTLARALKTKLEELGVKAVYSRCAQLNEKEYFGLEWESK